LLFSGNALAGIPSARWTGRRGPAGVWFLMTALCALVMAASRNPLVFGGALVGWGFVFFMGTPAAFNLLASRSNYPEERAGDAQAVMALGRVFGPIMGGALLAAGSASTLGVVAAAVMALGACLLLFVDRQRHAVPTQFDGWTPQASSVDAAKDA